MERKHFLYMMDPDKKAPNVGGSTLSWFQYYKWDAELGEVFVPMMDEHELVPGDILWFVMGSEVWGYAAIIRTDHATLSGEQELWYDTAQITRCAQPFKINPGDENSAWLLDGCLPAERGERWMETVRVLNLSVAE